MANFGTLLIGLFRAITTATARAIMAMVSAHEQSIKLTIAELAVRFVLLRTICQIVAELDGSDYSRVQ